MDRDLCHIGFVPSVTQFPPRTREHERCGENPELSGGADHGRDSGIHTRAEPTGGRGRRPWVQTPPGASSLTAAFQLGWRVAELYALVNDPGEPSDDTLLPSHESLGPGDQLQLQLRAAAGDARRAGIAAKADALEALLPDAGEAPASTEAAEQFRARIRSFHIDISKELWARDEGAGKAYELGNGMSDTYSLVRIAYRTRSEDLTTAWQHVFRHRRIERLEKLLDDLHSRLNPGGVAVVRHHLDLWRDAVPARIGESGRPPKEHKVKCGLRRQTVIWRQLLAGDKEPVAYLNGEARAQLHEEVRRLAWRGVRPWLIPAALGLFVFIFFLPKIVGFYQDGIVGTGVASAFLAVVGALGVTKGSMAATVRSRLGRWSELLWGSRGRQQGERNYPGPRRGPPRSRREERPSRECQPSHEGEDRLARGRTHPGLRETRQHLT